MKGRKKMSSRALEANRRNGRLSEGPRTPEGKARSARNAIKTGFFSPGLYVAEGDRETFERLKAGLEEQLRPTTILQRLHADAVIDAAWRFRQASQLDAQHLNQRLSQPGAEGIPAPATPTITEWYGSNPRAMRGALQFIDAIIPQVRRGGRVPESLVEDVKRAFGEEFYKALSEWETSGIDGLWVAENMIHKAKLYDLDLNRVLEANHKLEEGESPESEEVLKVERFTVNVVKDPRERAHMVVKLLEEKKQQMIELRHILQHVDGNLSGQQPSEPPYRYVAWAFHHLEKTLKSYMELVSAGL